MQHWKALISTIRTSFFIVFIQIIVAFTANFTFITKNKRLVVHFNPPASVVFAMTID